MLYRMGCCRDRFARTVVARLRHAGLAAEAQQLESVEGAWENLPNGWDEGSLKKMWKSLTGDRKHKITACAKKMNGKVDDPWAFCASLSRKIKG